MKKIIIALSVILVSCNNNEKLISLQKQIDSLKIEIKNIKQITSSSLKQTESNPKSEITVFIGKPMKYIKDFWATKITTEYFHEGVYTASHQKYFCIMTGDAGKPSFNASFSNDGLCVDHMTKIQFSDISVMKARLKNSGYVYDKTNDCWNLQGANYSWTITGPFGEDYEFTCTKK